MSRAQQQTQPAPGRPSARARGIAGAHATPLCLSLALLLAAAPLAAHALPPAAPDGSYVTNGPVTAIAHAAGRTYIGGDFTRVGLRSGAGVVLSPAGGREPFPEVAGGDVNAAISDGAGGWYIGGSFTAVDGQRRLGLAHVRGDGSVDPGFNPVVTDVAGRPATVNALVLSRRAPDAGTLYVGGEFTLIGIGQGQVHRNIAALRATDGKALLEFAPATSCVHAGCSPAVHSLALGQLDLRVADSAAEVPQSVVFIGGEFTRLEPADPPAEVRGLAAVWGVGSVDHVSSSNAGQRIGWAPQPSSLEGGTIVHALAVGEPALRDAADTSKSLAVYIAGWRRESAPAAIEPLVRGYQFQIANSAANRFMVGSGQFNETAWTPKPAGCSDCAVRALALDGEHLYFGGDFTQVGAPAQPAGRLAKIARIGDPRVTGNVAANRANAVALGAGVDGPVRSLALRATGTLLAGGDFDQLNGGDGSSARLVALDSASGARSPGWSSPSPDSSVRALASDASTSSLYAGGDIRALSAVARRGLAAFDSAGALLSWAPGLASDSGAPRIHALAASAGAVYVGGRFSAATGPAATGEHANLAAFGAEDGNPIASFDPDPALAGQRADVLSLALLDSTLYLGGAFDTVGGQRRENLAALDAASGALSPWNPAVEGRDEGAEPAVHAVLPACGSVYVGGRFERVGGQERANLAALDPASGAASAWNPHPEGGVNALAHWGSTIYASGAFVKIGGQSRNRVAGLNVADAAATPFNPGVGTLGAIVNALAVSDVAVYIGGAFDSVHNEPRLNLAAVDPASGAPTDWSPAADGMVEALALGGDRVYAGGSFGGLGPLGQRGFAAFGAGAGLPFGSRPCAAPEPAAAQDQEPKPPASAGPAPAPAAPGPRAPVSARAAIGRLAVRPNPVSLRAGSPLRAEFVLAHPLTVRLRFEQLVRARRRGAGAHAPRRCLRYVRFAALTRRGGRGLNRLAFPGRRVAGRRLRPGRYRVKLTPVGDRRGALERLAYFRVLAR